MAFARVNIREDGGRTIAQRYRVRAVPTFLMLAPDGKVLYRQTGGTPDRAAIDKQLARMIHDAGRKRDEAPPDGVTPEL